MQRVFAVKWLFFLPSPGPCFRQSFFSTCIIGYPIAQDVRLVGYIDEMQEH